MYRTNKDASWSVKWEVSDASMKKRTFRKENVADLWVPFKFAHGFVWPSLQSSKIIHLRVDKKKYVTRLKFVWNQKAF